MKTETTVSIINEIRKLSRYLDKYSKYLSNKYHITLPQLLCLNELRAEQELNLTELTRRLNLNNSAITGIIDRLELKNYVQRVKTGKDRRAIHLRLTDEGRIFAEKSLQIFDLDCFFDNTKITEQETEVLLQNLGKIISLLDPEVKKIDL
ncbi:MAG: MarR family winged helix-turn-helix transcriptional regulator [Deferribacterales bacterium]